MTSAALSLGEWDRPIRSLRQETPGRSTSSGAILGGRQPTFDEALDAWLAWRVFERSTERRAREHLQSTRARGWRETRGIRTIDQFTAAEATAYIVYMRDRGAAPATLRKLKTYFSSFAEFCAETPGYAGLQGDELTKLKLPRLVERIPAALTEEECLRLLASCDDPRDRLIIETLLLTGVRLSELCALTLDSFALDSRPAFVIVRGSVHNRRRPKASRERRIVIDYDTRGFGRGYVARLRRYIASERPPSDRPEVFLSQRPAMRTGFHPPLTTIGVQRLMTRLEAGSGVHCNAHRQRHTFATRCADNDVPLFQLQEALGHASLDMVRRYYTTSMGAMARGFYKAFGGSYA